MRARTTMFPFAIEKAEAGLVPYMYRRGAYDSAVATLAKRGSTDPHPRATAARVQAELLTILGQMAA